VAPLGPAAALASLPSLVLPYMMASISFCVITSGAAEGVHRRRGPAAPEIVVASGAHRATAAASAKAKLLHPWQNYNAIRPGQ
jgi:hypothetical protein